MMKSKRVGIFLVVIYNPFCRRKRKSEIRKIKWEKCMTRTLIAKKVSELLGVNCNRKLVASILDKKRSSQLDKLLKKE